MGDGPRTLGVGHAAAHQRVAGAVGARRGAQLPPDAVSRGLDYGAVAKPSCEERKATKQSRSAWDYFASLARICLGADLGSRARCAGGEAVEQRCHRFPGLPVVGEAVGFGWHAEALL